MARYENPPQPLDGNVNVSGSALGEFVRLAVILAVSGVALVVAVTFGMRLLAPYIPFRYEVSFAKSLAEKLDSGKDTPKRQYLQKLTGSLAARMALPEGMTLAVHIDGASGPNAFATLGGHIIVTQGLLDLVDSENALAMVIAHEIGHIKHRDPIASAGSGIVIAIVMGALFGNSDLASLGNTPGLLTQLNFSRAQESAADRAALDALTAYYGHTGGAGVFFQKMLEKQHGEITVPEFLSTHPDLEQRLASIQAADSSRAHTALTPLPAVIKEKSVHAD